MWARRYVFVLLGACSGDAPPSSDAPPTPDAGSCLGANVSCSGDVLTTCTAAGETPVAETCGWGCEVTPAPACKRIDPTGGGATANDLLPSMLGVFPELSLSGNIDGSTGKINGLDASGMGIGFTVVNGVGVFRFKLLAIGGIKLQGTAPIQLISDGPITVNGTIDATGSCGIGAPDIAGAGGGNGGQTSGADGALIGGGAGGANVAGGIGGGGGGGWGGTGGVSSGGELGGISAGDAVVTILRGGGGGGAGVGSTRFQGGGGGGGIQLISNTSITIAVAGNINAGGCGGRGGSAADDQGGGGGAGGSIVLEAPEVTLAGGRVLAVNGGGGGGGGAGATDGGSGQLSRNQAVGGNAGTGGASGGAGAAAATIDGAAGNAGTISGGGGGAAGRIRINTRSGAAVIEGVMSPALDDPNSTATQGTATLQ